MAVIGGGWAGLAAAVRAVERGHRVTLLEMAPHWGGRARRVDTHGLTLDNGQHILIGAYTQTLALMRTVGAAPEALLLRRPLALVYPDGSGLRLWAGAPVSAFVRGVLAARGWSWHVRLALLGAAARWRWAGFQAPAQATVADLTRGLPQRLRDDLIDPLCIAALNTPADRASAQVFLRVLHDALFAGPGAADLLLPRAPLSALLPLPAARWLHRAGARLELTRRVMTLAPAEGGWAVDGERFEAVILACSATEAGRLANEAAPGWAASARDFDYEPIVTVYLRSVGSRLAQPLTALRTGPDAPAQFAFDLGALGGPPGVFAFVVSGAGGWLGQQGLQGTAEAVLTQAMQAFAGDVWRTPPTLLYQAAEKRATFVCAPGLRRPPAFIAMRLAAAGDYVAGPYPSTLEGAVRSGQAAIDVAFQAQA